jgi:hypothetical protein
VASTTPPTASPPHLDVLFGDLTIAPDAPSGSAAASRQVDVPPSQAVAAHSSIATADAAAPAPRRPSSTRVPRVSAASPAAPPGLTGITCSGRQTRPVDRLSLSVIDTSVAAVPTTFRQAMQDPCWRAPMADEHQALIDNNTWSLVPQPPRANVVTGKWIYRHKFHFDGTQAKLSNTDGNLLSDATKYMSIVGALWYLTLTRSDISYVVKQICLHMHALRAPHLALVKRVLRYIYGTMDCGLHLRASSSTRLTAYSNADWAYCPNSRRSTSC